MAVGLDEHHLKPAVGAPVVERRLRPEHEHRGRQAVGHGAVLAHDRHGQEAVIHRPPGLGGEDVVVFLPTLGEKALVAAGGDDGRLANGEIAEIAAGVVRILHGDIPVASVRLFAERLHVAAEGHHAARDAGGAHGLNGIVRRAALGHGAEAQRHVCRHGHEIICAVVRARELHLAHVHAREQTLDLRVRRDAVVLVDEAPELAQGVGRQVERAVRALGHGLRRAQHLGDLLVDDDGAAHGVIDLVGLAALVFRVEQRVHAVDDADGGADAVVRLLTVGGQIHDGVHGEDLLRGAFCLAAGAQRQHERAAQQQREQAGVQTFMVHRGRVLPIQVSCDQYSISAAKWEQKILLYISTGLCYNISC